MKIFEDCRRCQRRKRGTPEEHGVGQVLLKGKKEKERKRSAGGGVGGERKKYRTEAMIIEMVRRRGRVGRKTGKTTGKKVEKWRKGIPRVFWGGVNSWGQGENT